MSWLDSYTPPSERVTPAPTPRATPEATPRPQPVPTPEPTPKVFKGIPREWFHRREGYQGHSRTPEGVEEGWKTEPPPPMPMPWEAEAQPTPMPWEPMPWEPVPRAPYMGPFSHWRGPVPYDWERPDYYFGVPIEQTPWWGPSYGGYQPWWEGGPLVQPGSLAPELDILPERLRRG